TREVGSLLGGDLGGWGVLGLSAVAYSPDSLSSINNEVLIDGKTTAGSLLLWNLIHEVSDDWTNGISGSPDKAAVWNTLLLARSVGEDGLNLDVLVGDVLDHGLGSDIDLLVSERLFRVVDESLAEHG